MTWIIPSETRGISSIRCGNVPVTGNPGRAHDLPARHPRFFQEAAAQSGKELCSLPAYQGVMKSDAGIRHEMVAGKKSRMVRLNERHPSNS